MDVILSHQAGFENTVASSGTALSDFQLTVIKRYTANLHTAFDRDTAGSSATARGIDLAQKASFDIKVILMPQGKDPADIISQNPSEWQKAIDSAKDITEFYFEDAFLKFDSTAPLGKKQIAAFLLPQIKKIQNSIVRSHWLQKLALALNVSVESISDELKKIPSQAQVQAQKQETDPGSNRNDRYGLNQGQNGKNRLQLLEEKILALVFKSPAAFEAMANDDLDLFSQNFQTILISCKQNGLAALQNFQENSELKIIIDNCSFQAEVEQVDDIEKEMQVCLESFRKVSWQNQLQKIANEIKLAERAGDLQKAKELMSRFSQLSKSNL